VSPDYVIGPNDALQIDVWKEPQVSGKLPVRPDGMISLPLVGDMPAAGFTPMQLGQEVSSRLKKFINDPAVTVTVMAVNSKQVYMLGEISRVGPLPMAPGMTPLQAIATAGGLTAYASAKHIYILRTVAGKQQKIPFDYKKAVKDGNMQGVTLLSGDTIVVP
jgi:polysaccharide export outer membrane protein